ncbi:MAG: ParB/RepB/Spo0J family partition protein, partial [Hyphomicrobiaceae bacterium]
MVGMIQQVEELEVVGAVVSLPVSRIVRNPDQPRKRFHERKLQELGESMRDEGQQEPVKVFPVEDGMFMLENGERRWRAAQRVRLATLNCIIVSRPDQRELLVNSVIMGLHQENLTPMEEAAAYHTLQNVHGMNTFQISKAVGRSDPFVRSRLIWMDTRIPEGIRELIDNHQFPKTPDVANALFTLPNNDVRLKLAQRLAGKTGKAIILACEKYL